MIAVRPEKLTRPINLDGAIITPLSKDETPLQLLDRALSMGAKLHDEVVTALFGCTPDKIMEFAQAQGWMQERTLGHAVNVGVYAENWINRGRTATAPFARWTCTCVLPSTLPKSRWRNESGRDGDRKRWSNSSSERRLSAPMR
jgi:hypothetical protein